MVPTWPKISDLEAIGIHTHDSHPVKIRLVIWHPRVKLCSSLAARARNRSNISKIYVRLLQSPRHSTGQHAMIDSTWRFDRKLLQESLLWIRFLQKKAGTTQLKASKFDTSLRHISIEHISIECVMLLMQCPQKEKQRCLGVSSWFRAVSMLDIRVFSTSWGKL